MQEQQQEQQDKLSELIDKVNDQAQMVGEMQQNHVTLQGGSGPRIPQLQGQVPAHSSIASSGSVPRIPQQYTHTHWSLWCRESEPTRTSKFSELSEEEYEESRSSHLLR